MFKARHDELLEQAFFSGSNDKLQVVEMWKYAGVWVYIGKMISLNRLTASQVKNVEDGKNFRHASLPADEVELWLAADKHWKPPEPLSADPDVAFEGGIRLL